MRRFLTHKHIWLSMWLGILAILSLVTASAGPYRNAYLCGAMPWHRSFRDLNMCTGNLMKSSTDIQVAPARGAGLVLQRTYNSNDERVGPFGRGWSHAYDIRMEEASSQAPELADSDITFAHQSDGDPSSKEDKAVSTDFFGGRHVYRRDADGLYTPPPYMHDWRTSDYAAVLDTGPGDVNSDVEIGLDGTEKWFSVYGNERICDAIKDRNGNTTALEYTAYTVKAGVTKKLLTKVTDPSGRELNFTWEAKTPSDPTDYRYRVTQVTGPLQAVTYSYYQPNETGWGGEAYNLKSVTVDPSELNRTTTYTYTSITGSQGTAYGLLASITDPLGHTVSYNYDLEMVNPQCPLLGPQNYTGAVWVNEITEPGGVYSNGSVRPLVWGVRLQGTEVTGNPNFVISTVWDKNATVDEENDAIVNVLSDYPRLRQRGVWTAYELAPYDCPGFYTQYDDNDNPILTWTWLQGYAQYAIGLWHYIREDNYYYGRSGNVLYHWVTGFSDADPREESFNLETAYGVDKYRYYDEDKYFQTREVADAAGHMTTFDYGSRYDARSGYRGSLLWARDARHQPDGAALTYEYDEDTGQKTSEIDLNGVITQFTYGDTWGNLTQTVQDPGSGHLNRTTDMVYDAAGRVTDRTDPIGRTSHVNYNAAGQPEDAFFPATETPYPPTPSETVTYAYDANGRLDSVSDNRGTTGITYEDELYSQPQAGDRVAIVSDPITGTISYTYKRRGSVASKTLPGGVSWHYTYDSMNWWGWDIGYLGALSSDDPNGYHDVLHEIKDGQGRVVCENNYNGWGSEKFNIRYDANGEQESYCTVDYVKEGNTAPQYGDSEYSHDWLYSVTYKFRWNYGEDSKVLAKNVYEYDAIGNRISNTISYTDVQQQYHADSRTESYGYDELSRLWSVDYGVGETNRYQTFTFDDMGNRISDRSDQQQNYFYNAANMLWKYDSQTQNYFNDANGNQTAGGGRTNIWDSQNRLAGCTYSSITSAFTYGSDSLRRSMTVGNSPTVHYALDSQSVAQEGHLDGGSFAVDVTYLQGPRGVEYRKDENTGDVRWYLHDGLGSVVAELDESTSNSISVTATRKHDVYGGIRESTGTGVGTQAFCGALGHVQEPASGPTNTGLIYMGARWMDPVTGRFLSEDPQKDGANWYAYCDNDPVNAVDSSGEAKIRISKDFWIRWDDAKSHVHWGNGDVEMGAATRDGKISHKFRFKKFPSKAEMKKLGSIKTKAARMAYDSITAAFEQNPFFVIGLFLDIAGDFDAADEFYRAGGVID